MAHGLIKWVLKKQAGLNGLGKREEANAWQYIEKREWATAGPK